ncbi:hypothetical protein IWX90DRAFT_159872 [Phyllosticta citrichinensis]|uniref:Uncharacterized protein n=1 Tax=Phyllosticta citrichinensis TaxID=1130410 RepID=A0ABR1Y098_9PEZI
MTLRVVLAGAPDPERLSWDDSLLVCDWVPAIARFLELTAGTTASGGSRDRNQDLQEEALYRWRSVPLATTRLQTGLTQEFGSLNVQQFHGVLTQRSVDETAIGNSLLPSSNTQPLRGTRGGNCGAEQDDEDSRFIEYSMAVHDALLSSQLDLSLSPLEETTMLDSFNSNMYMDQSNISLSQTTQADVRLPRAIKNLCEIPSAGHLKRIIPQTIVVNLIVGVISILPPHSKQTRYGLRDMAEILVGDETGIGFKVTFWFPARESQRANGGARVAPPEPLRDALENLRLQDVVLIENVALDSFRDKVFGSSLRKSTQKTQTKLQLLARHGVDKMGGLASVEKVARVKDWVSSFANPHGDAGGAAKDGGWKGQELSLPPDTQD